MREKVLLSVALLLISAALIGCSGASADMIYGRDDTQISVKAGDTFTIRLEENPTTGYAWTADISDQTVVELAKEEYKQESAEEDIVGAGGVKELTFKALKKGEAAVTLKYERSFEEDSAVETLVYNITVK